MGALALGGRYSVIPFTLIRHPQQQVHEVVWRAQPQPYVPTV